MIKFRELYEKTFAETERYKILQSIIKKPITLDFIFYVLRPVSPKFINDKNNHQFITYDIVIRHSNKGQEFGIVLKDKILDRGYIYFENYSIPIIKDELFLNIDYEIVTDTNQLKEFKNLKKLFLKILDKYENNEYL